MKKVSDYFVFFLILFRNFFYSSRQCKNLHNFLHVIKFLFVGYFGYNHHFFICYHTVHSPTLYFPTNNIKTFRVKLAK